MNVTYTNGAGFFSSSALTGATPTTGIYTLIAENEIIIFRIPGSDTSVSDFKVNSLTVYAQGTPLRIVPNGEEEYGFIYIPANTSKVIQVGAMTSIKVLNAIGSTIYFEATFI